MTDNANSAQGPAAQNSSQPQGAGQPEQRQALINYKRDDIRYLYTEKVPSKHLEFDDYNPNRPQRSTPFFKTTPGAEYEDYDECLKRLDYYQDQYEARKSLQREDAVWDPIFFPPPQAELPPNQLFNEFFVDIIVDPNTVNQNPLQRGQH